MKYKIDAKKWLVSCVPPIIFAVFLVWLEESTSPRFDSVFEWLRTIFVTFVVLVAVYVFFVIGKLPSLKESIYRKKEPADDSTDDN